MDLGGLKNGVRQLALLNLRFYSSLVDLSRNYLDTLKNAIELGGVTSAPPLRQSEAPPPAAPPLLLAARAGERAQGAFAIVNNLQQTVDAAVQVTGDIDPTKLQLSPQDATLAPGEQLVVRMSVAIDDAMVVGRDLHAAVSIPGLGSRAIAIVVRRLADTAPAGASGKAERPSSATPPPSAAPTSAKANRAAEAASKRKSS
jgi:hypothetical protein